MTSRVCYFARMAKSEQSDDFPFHFNIFDPVQLGLRFGCYSFPLSGCCARVTGSTPPFDYNLRVAPTLRAESAMLRFFAAALFSGLLALQPASFGPKTRSRKKTRSTSISSSASTCRAA